MWNEPTRKALLALPRLYETDKIPVKDKLIHMHFFIGGCDWYVAEFDGEDLFFGFVNLNDPLNAEWGFFSLTELKSIMVQTPLRDALTGEVLGAGVVEIDRDLHWEVRPFSEVHWQGPDETQGPQARMDDS